MNLPFILDLTISQHPFITEELQRITVWHYKYDQTCHMSMARLSYVRLEGHCCCADLGLLGCEVTSFGKWFSVFPRQYSPLKHWNHSPSDIAS